MCFWVSESSLSMISPATLCCWIITETPLFFIFSGALIYQELFHDAFLFYVSLAPQETMHYSQWTTMPPLKIQLDKYLELLVTEVKQLIDTDTADLFIF